MTMSWVSRQQTQLLSLRTLTQVSDLEKDYHRESFEG